MTKKTICVRTNVQSISLNFSQYGYLGNSKAYISKKLEKWIICCYNTHVFCLTGVKRLQKYVVNSLLIIKILLLLFFLSNYLHVDSILYSTEFLWNVEVGSKINMLQCFRCSNLYNLFSLLKFQILGESQFLLSLLPGWSIFNQKYLWRFCVCWSRVATLAVNF